MSKFLCALAVALASGTGAAWASTVIVEFDTDTLIRRTNDTDTFESQGFYYSTSNTYAFGPILYMHDDSGILQSEIRAIDGAYFTPQIIDVFGVNRVKKTGSGPAPIDENGEIADLTPEYWEWATSGNSPVTTLSFQGMRDGRQVAQQTVSTNAYEETDYTDPANHQALFFGSAFTAIDSLLLSVSIPQGVQDYRQPNNVSDYLYCTEWCVDFVLDDMVVSKSVTLLPAPIPLPSTFPMLAAGLAGLGFWRRKKA